jgi:hypothetical protein
MSESPDPVPGKSRRWFVILAWITLVLFGLFVCGITLLAVRIPEIRKASGH